MKLTRYALNKDPKERLGVIIKDNLLDTQTLAEQLNLEIPENMDALLQDANKGLAQLDKVIDKAMELHFPLKKHLHKQVNVRYLPLIKQPEKIICVGLNYIERIKATDGDVPTTPVFFTKLPNTLAAHQQEIPIPSIAQKVDYEAELVVVIGKEIHNACHKVAQEAILGYTIGNDLSERHFQFETSQWMIGKNFDYFAPIGPTLVTKDEIADVQNLTLVTKRNGEIVQHASTSDMLHTVEHIISEASQFMTLNPGDLIFTGTPKGVILEQEPETADWLKPQDTLSISIESLGTLTNTLV